MSLSINPLGKDVPPEPEVPRIYSDTYKHSIVESSYQPETSLLSMVEGSPRRGEYYRCFLGQSEEAYPFSPENTGTYQSYERIKNAIIKQEGDGAFNFDPEKTESTKVFNGWVTAAMRPTKYDVIIFDIGDGNAGLFTVTEQPEIRNVTANKMFYITYQFLCILTNDQFARLNERVVKELMYSKDAELNGGQSVISTGEYLTGEELFKWRGTIANYLMRTFYWTPEKTIAFETTEGQMVYDPYLVNFIIAVLPPDLRTMYPFINEFSVQYGGLERGYSGTINVWEVLMRGDFNLLQVCNNKAAMIQVQRLIGTRTYGNLTSSKFYWFVATNPEDFQQYRAYFNFDGFPIMVPSVEQAYPGYVFSEEFFAGDPVDEFEKMVFSILKYKVCDKKKLLDYCKTYFTLPKRKQLYNGAILLLLLEVSRRLGDPQ